MSKFVQGSISSIIGLFTGGAPSTEDVIKKEFDKQKQFLIDAFAETAKLIEGQKIEMEETALSEYIINGNAELEVLTVKHKFIMHFKQLEQEEVDDVAPSIVNEMNFFDHSGTSAFLRHAFEMKATTIMCGTCFVAQPIVVGNEQRLGSLKSDFHTDGVSLMTQMLDGLTSST